VRLRPRLDHFKSAPLVERAPGGGSLPGTRCAVFTADRKVAWRLIADQRPTAESAGPGIERICSAFGSHTQHFALSIASCSVVARVCSAAESTGTFSWGLHPGLYDVARPLRALGTAGGGGRSGGRTSRARRARRWPLGVARRWRVDRRRHGRGNWVETAGAGTGCSAASQVAYELGTSPPDSVSVREPSGRSIPAQPAPPPNDEVVA
jgi:hypothetical protein